MPGRCGRLIATINRSTNPRPNSHRPSYSTWSTMQARIKKTYLESVLLIEPEVYRDPRGFFTEVYRQDQFARLGIPEPFVQLNHSASAQGVLRGLHFQWDPPMAKLMRVTQGRAFLVAVDIRKNSPTLGSWVGLEATGEEPLLLWAPAGFARGFCVLSDRAEIEYLCTAVYNPDAEASIRWNDPLLNISWPISAPILSGRDQNAYLLSDWLTTANSELVRL